MKIRSFSRFFKQAVIILLSALVLETLVKSVNIILLTGSFSMVFSQKMVIQLLTVAIIPDLLTYTVLIGIGYHFMKKNEMLNEEQHKKDMELEKRKASHETAQKMTGLMIDVIGEYNNQIKSWIYVRQQKGQQPPQKVEHASTMIGKSLHALAEFSYIVPYIENNNETIDTVIEGMRLQLKSTDEIKKIEAPVQLQ